QDAALRFQVGALLVDPFEDRPKRGFGRPLLAGHRSLQSTTREAIRRQGCAGADGGSLGILRRRGAGPGPAWMVQAALEARRTSAARGGAGRRSPAPARVSRPERAGAPRARPALPASGSPGS